jgi:uncharacterized membrane protein YdjX (TVP38/TMEM64 family)
VAPVAKVFLKVLLILVLTGTALAVIYAFCSSLLSCFTAGAAGRFWWPDPFFPAAIALIRSSGIVGVFVSIGLMIIHSFVPFPAELVAIANGMVYGPFWGTVLTWVGAMGGAFLAFGLTRQFGQPFVRKIVSPRRSQALDRWVARHGAETLFVSRFIPVISFNLINYAAGLTKISWGTFSWTTGLGILPMTILMVVMGNQIHVLPWSAWMLLLCGGFLLLLLLHRLRHKDTA